MRAALQLPLEFDADGLAADLSGLASQGWIPHFNHRDYEGQWSAFALRGPASATHPIQAVSSPPGETAFADQPALAASPHIKAALARLHCPLRSVRLLRLGAGATIREHSDHELGPAFGEARLHAPILTNASVDFRIAGERVTMRPGELWLLDASEPHSVANRGETDRVHMVIDCVVNDWLRALLTKASEQG